MVNVGDLDSDDRKNRHRNPPNVDLGYLVAYCFGVPLGDARSEWATLRKSPAGRFHFINNPSNLILQKIDCTQFVCTKSIAKSVTFSIETLARILRPSGADVV